MLPIRFKPFVGANYENENFKILVLGESHYLGKQDMKAFEDKDPRIENITKSVVTGYLNYKKTGKDYYKWMNTFTKFTNALNGKQSSIKEINSFWRCSSFYNYVQAPTKGPRQSPTKEDFKLSIDAFEKVVDELKPNLIFIWGNRLWNNFPKSNYHKSCINNKTIHFINFNQKIPIMVIPHPSSSKFNRSTYKEIEDYIIAVKTMGSNV